MSRSDVRPRRSKAFVEGLPACKVPPVLRPCLGFCGQLFWSSWSGHRICPKCSGKQPRRDTLTTVHHMLDS